jgi:hypothetical protein
MRVRSILGLSSVLLALGCAGADTRTGIEFALPVAEGRSVAMVEYASDDVYSPIDVGDVQLFFFRTTTWMRNPDEPDRRRIARRCVLDDLGEFDDSGRPDRPRLLTRREATVHGLTVEEVAYARSTKSGEELCLYRALVGERHVIVLIAEANTPVVSIEQLHALLDSMDLRETG